MLPIIAFGFVFLVCGLFLMHRFGKRGDGELFDRSARWIITAVLAVVLLGGVKAVSGGGPAGGVVGLFVVIPVCVILSFLWVPSMVGSVLSALTGALTGGTEQIKPAPFYFRAQARRKKGEFVAALAEIDGELLRFPDDLEGHLLKAEILSEDLKDVAGALSLLQAFEVGQNRTAGDRNLSRFRRIELLQHRLSDVDGARIILEHIVADDPESEAAHTAQQRLAHLSDPAQTLRNRPKLLVTRHEQSLGLTEDLGASQRVEENAGLRASELLKHLEAHPGDWESRERLATVYSDYFGNIPLAVDQIRQLVGQPNLPEKRIAGWLNRIADLHLQAGNGLPAAKAALEEIHTRFPGSAWAEQAAIRIGTLGRSERIREAPRTLQIGTYEQNIGLKRGSADIPNPDPDAPTR